MNDAHRAMSRNVRKARISTSALRKRRYHKAALPARRTVMRSHPEKKNLMDLFGVLGNGKQTDEDFETIRDRARREHYNWLKSEGKL